MNKKIPIAITLVGIMATSYIGLSANPQDGIPEDDIVLGVPMSPPDKLPPRNSIKNIVPKTGNQKELVVLLNMSDQPFEKDEEYYNEIFFGNTDNSINAYLADQANGKFSISPVDTPGSKYPGIIKIDVPTDSLGAISSTNYNEQLKLINEILEANKDKFDLTSADKNSDKKFNDSWYQDRLDSLEELHISVIMSGNTSKDKPNAAKIQSWPHSVQFNIPDLNGFNLTNSGIVSSEKVDGFSLGASTMVHEFLHNLNARDMYNDSTSIGIWSIMDTSFGNRNGEEQGADPTPLDPIHKVKYGWLTPQEVTISNTMQTIDIDSKKCYYVDKGNEVYILEYRDFDNKYEKANYRYGLRGSGLIIWKVDKEKLSKDWLDKDWMVNSEGARTAVYVMTKDGGKAPFVDNALTSVGKTATIDELDCDIKVNNKQLIIKPKGVEIAAPTIQAIDREVKQFSKFNPMEGVRATDGEGKDITSDVKVDHDVNTDIVNDYKVTYSVTAHSKTTTKEVKVTVKPSEVNIPKPIITAENKTLNINEEFKPLEGVTAKDGEGIDITDKIEVLENTVNSKEEGRYIVIYGVKDRLQQQSTKGIIVTVVDKEIKPEEPKDTVPPVITGATSKTIKRGDIFDPLNGVSATDNTDGIVEVRIVSNNLDTSKVGTYTIVYEAIDSSANKANINRTIEVIPNEEDNKPKDTVAPVINVTSDKMRLPVNSAFDPLSMVTATDDVDGDVTHALKVKESNLNLSKPGNYKLVFEVSDKAGNKSSKALSVEIYVPDIIFLAPDIKLHVNSKFDPMDGVKVSSGAGEDITAKVKITANTVNINKEGMYKIRYEVNDSYGNKITHVRVVTVVPSSVAIDKPSIKIKRRLFEKGEEFKGLEGVTAQDSNGNDITKELVIDSSNVDTKVVGAYKQTLSVTDKDGNTNTIMRDVYVLPFKVAEGAPHIYLKQPKILVDTEFTLKSLVSVLDSEDGILDGKAVVKSSNLDIRKPGIYSVEYMVVDSDGNVTTQTFDIRVVKTLEDKDEDLPDKRPVKPGTGGGTTDNGSSKPDTNKPVTKPDENNKPTNGNKPNEGNKPNVINPTDKTEENKQDTNQTNTNKLTPNTNKDKTNSEDVKVEGNNESENKEGEFKPQDKPLSSLPNVLNNGLSKTGTVKITGMLAGISCLICGFLLWLKKKKF